MFRRNATLSGGDAPNAANNALAVIAVSTFGGRGRENSRDRKSARSVDCSNTALYIRCVSMFWRRMSKMNEIFGFSATMYVKFWSGPTPRYTPPGLVVRSNSGITH